MNQNRTNLDLEITLHLLKKESHGRELARQLATPLSSIQRALKRLQKENIIDFKAIGKNKMYSLKKSIAARQTIFNAEN